MNAEWEIITEEEELRTQQEEETDSGWPASQRTTLSALSVGETHTDTVQRISEYKDTRAVDNKRTEKEWAE